MHGKGLVENKSGQWRYRIGAYRVICEIQDKEILGFSAGMSRSILIWKSARICLSDFQRHWPTTGRCLSVARKTSRDMATSGNPCSIADQRTISRTKNIRSSKHARRSLLRKKQHPRSQLPPTGWQHLPPPSRSSPNRSSVVFADFIPERSVDSLGL